MSVQVLCAALTEKKANSNTGATDFRVHYVLHIHFVCD